jgi:WD40 repeat protein
MKISSIVNRRLLFRALSVFLIAGAGLLAVPKRADAQLYVTQVQAGTVGEYNATTGAVINASFITGLSAPNALLLSGSDLLVANESGSVGEYNASTGAAINQSFITGTNFQPIGLALSGTDLFVANIADETVGKYNVTTGATIKVPFISKLPATSSIGLGTFNTLLFVAEEGQSKLPKYLISTGGAKGAVKLKDASPYGVAVSGSDLFVTSLSAGTISEYNAKTGAVIKASFITGLNLPTQIAILGSDLYVVNYGAGTVGEYNVKTGAVVNASLISGLTDPWGIAAQ